MSKKSKNIFKNINLKANKNLLLGVTLLIIIITIFAPKLIDFTGRPTQTCTDFDGDGYGAIGTDLSLCTSSRVSLNFPDCNDTDSDIHTIEICEDGKDNDCDGDIDLADQDCKFVQVPGENFQIRYNDIKSGLPLTFFNAEQICESLCTSCKIPSKAQLSNFCNNQLNLPESISNLGSNTQFWPYNANYYTYNTYWTTDVDLKSWAFLILFNEQPLCNEYVTPKTNVRPVRCIKETSQITTPAPPTCGDNKAESPEVCDGADLKGEDCTTLGFTLGTLACSSDCQSFDTSQCTITQVTQDQLVIYYKFEDNTQDSSGNNYHAQLFDGTYQLGKVGQALSLDGEDDYISIDVPAELQSPQQLTISKWVYTTKTGLQTIFSRSSGGDLGWHIFLGFVDNILYSQFTDHGLSSQTINPDQWYYITVTWDGSNLKNYINGVEVSSFSLTEIDNIGTKLVLGKILSESKIPSLFQGLIDELRIYNYALSSEEIENIYTQESTPTPTCTDTDPQKDIFTRGTVTVDSNIMQDGCGIRETSTSVFGGTSTYFRSLSSCQQPNCYVKQYSCKTTVSPGEDVYDISYSICYKCYNGACCRTSETICDDGIDNDCDGYTDSADSDCITCGNNQIDAGEECEGGIGCYNCICNIGYQPKTPVAEDCEIETEPITCTDDDNYCPSGCDSTTDNDCPAIATTCDPQCTAPEICDTDSSSATYLSCITPACTYHQQCTEPNEVCNIATDEITGICEPCTPAKRYDIDSDNIADNYCENQVLTPILTIGEVCTANYQCIDNICEGTCLKYTDLAQAFCEFKDFLGQMGDIIFSEFCPTT